MDERIPSLAPMIQVSPPPVPVEAATPLWPWLLVVAVGLLLLLWWQRWRIWLVWQRWRVNEHTAQAVARRVYGRLRRHMPQDVSLALQRIAFAPHVSHETVQRLKQLLREVKP